MTAIAPSPTADATRLTERDRTSPAAKTPGRWSPVEGVAGLRPAGGRWPATTRSGPVGTKPCSSRTITASSHSVRGAAPMNTNSDAAATVSSPGVADGEHEPLQPGVAVAAATSVPVRTSMVGERVDLVDQIRRHRRHEAGSPHQQRRPARKPGEEHRRLTRRVGAADDEDVLALVLWPPARTSRRTHRGRAARARPAGRASGSSPPSRARPRARRARGLADPTSGPSPAPPPSLRRGR